MWQGHRNTQRDHTHTQTASSHTQIYKHTQLLTREAYVHKFAHVHEHTHKSSYTLQDHTDTGFRRQTRVDKQNPSPCIHQNILQLHTHNLTNALPHHTTFSDPQCTHTHTFPVSLTFHLLVSTVPDQLGGGFAADTGAGQGDFAPLWHWVLKAGDLRVTGHTWREIKKQTELAGQTPRDNFYAEGLNLVARSSFAAKLGCIEFGGIKNKPQKI